MNQEVHAMKGKVASKVVDYAVEAEKQKLKKKAKKRVKSVIFRIFGTLFVFRNLICIQYRSFCWNPLESNTGADQKGRDSGGTEGPLP